MALTLKKPIAELKPQEQHIRVRSLNTGRTTVCKTSKHFPRRKK